jgi:two-component system cell cycle response regulator CpdR
MARILVVDDDEAMRLLLRAVLERQGYEVVEAENGYEGLLCYHAEPTDLVITDMEMPVMNGLELLQALQHAVPPAAVIVISGNPHALTQARTLTPHTFVKPFEPRQVLTAVQMLVAAQGVP